MIAPHPQRCDTCEYKTALSADSGMCDCSKLKRSITWQQWCIIRDGGCASHSTASNDSDILRELIRIATIGRENKEKGLGKKYCREHPKQVDSCHHWLLRTIEQLRTRTQEQP